MLVSLPREQSSSEPSLIDFSPLSVPCSSSSLSVSNTIQRAVRTCNPGRASRLWTSSFMADRFVATHSFEGGRRPHNFLTDFFRELSSVLSSSLSPFTDPYTFLISPSPSSTLVVSRTLSKSTGRLRRLPRSVCPTKESPK